MFELCATECLVEMQILIQEFADIKSEAHESYEVGAWVCGFVGESFVGDHYGAIMVVHDASS